MTTAAVLHPGNMGAAVAKQALRNADHVLWYPVGRSIRTVQRAENSGLTPIEDISELLSCADVILSICPPGRAAEDVARLVAAGHYRGLYVEANAISPQRSIGIANLLTANGARVLDGAIIGYPPGDQPKTTLYLSGKSADMDEVSRLFSDTTCVPYQISGEIGTASALKCAFSSYQKAVHSIAGLAFALADYHGVGDQLLAEAVNRAPGSPFAQPHRLTEGAAKAWRWQPEFSEIADALREANLSPAIATAVGQVLTSWASLKDDTSVDLAHVLTHLKTNDDHSGAG